MNRKCPLCDGSGLVAVDNPVMIAGKPPNTITFHHEMPCPACPAGAVQMHLVSKVLRRHESDFR